MKINKIKYIIVECVYDKDDTDRDKYILSSTIIYPSRFDKKSMVERSVFLKVNDKSNIDNNEKIFRNIFNQVLEASIK